jgi:hypothetical protein
MSSHNFDRRLMKQRRKRRMSLKDQRPAARNDFYLQDHLTRLLRGKRA